MWPLLLLGLGGAAWFFEKEAKARTATWQPRMLSTPNTPVPPQGSAVYVSLYNMATGEARDIAATVTSGANETGKYTLLLGKSNGYPPYGWAEGSFVELSPLFFAELKQQ